MTPDEIVRALREMLPPKVDYAEMVCAEGFAHGQCYVWDDPEPYIISAAADCIESLQAQLADYHHTRKLADGKMAENQRLRRINENLQEQLAASQHMPTVDAVEVVRCRDCVHFGECLVTENDYCSKGERKGTD